jgi:hypothetical protein
MSRVLPERHRGVAAGIAAVKGHPLLQAMLVADLHDRPPAPQSSIEDRVWGRGADSMQAAIRFAARRGRGVAADGVGRATLLVVFCGTAPTMAVLLDVDVHRRGMAHIAGGWCAAVGPSRRLPWPSCSTNSGESSGPMMPASASWLPQLSVSGAAPARPQAIRP